MAVLHVKSPNGTDYNMNLNNLASNSGGIGGQGWAPLPNGVIIQWGASSQDQDYMFRGYLSIEATAIKLVLTEHHGGQPAVTGILIQYDEVAQYPAFFAGAIWTDQGAPSIAGSIVYWLALTK